MCYTCGCRRPYDTMGDAKNIVEKFFEEAGQTRQLTLQLHFFSG